MEQINKYALIDVDEFIKGLETMFWFYPNQLDVIRRRLFEESLYKGSKNLELKKIRSCASISKEFLDHSVLDKKEIIYGVLRHNIISSIVTAIIDSGYLEIGTYPNTSTYQQSYYADVLVGIDRSKLNESINDKINNLLKEKDKNEQQSE